MLIIIHGNIKTMEGRDYEDGFLQIKDGKIAAVGRMEDCDPALLRDRKRVQVLDARGNLVMPTRNGNRETYPALFVSSADTLWP